MGELELRASCPRCKKPGSAKSSTGLLDVLGFGLTLSGLRSNANSIAGDPGSRAFVHRSHMAASAAFKMRRSD